MKTFRQIRREIEFTQIEIAEKLDISIATVRRIEAGEIDSNLYLLAMEGFYHRIKALKSAPPQFV